MSAAPPAGRPFAVDWGEAAALVVVAESGRDPDLAPFVAPAHLGDAILVWWRGEAPRLGYLTPMERDEARATGLELLTPEALGVDELRDRHPEPGPFLAALLERALDGRDPGELLLAGHAGAGAVAEASARLGEAGWRLRSGQSAIRRCRRTKTARDAAWARAAARGAGRALARVAALLAGAVPSGDELVAEGEPLTVGRLRREIARILAEDGLEQPEGNIVAPGADAGVPHSRGDDERRLTAGETLVVDLFPRGELFADVTRTFCVGEPAEEVRAAHAAVEAALAAARDGARPGAVGFDLQRAACDHFERLGYPTPIGEKGTLRGYVHGLGHGVGYELHELPSFRREAGADGVLAEGDLITLEPGLYEPDRGWGIRLEDLCWLGPDGLEILTPLPTDLDPRAWS